MKLNLFNIAVKNLARHKTKTIFTTLAVMISVGLFIFMDSMLLGLDIDSRRNLVMYETGSSKVYSKAYFEKKDELPLYESFGDYKSVIEKLNDAGYDAAPHAVFVGSLISIEQEQPFLFVGIDPELEKTIFRYHNFLEGSESRFVENGQFKVVLGVKGAYDLKVGIGDKVRAAITIDIKDENGKVRHVHQLIDLAVAGIVNSPNPKTNGNICYLPLDILQDEMGIMLEGKITEICIRKKGAVDTALPGADEYPEYMLEKMGPMRDDLVLVSWEEDAKDFLTIARTKSVGNKTMIIILFILSVMGIANTMLMAVLERIKELGMLRALGLLNGQIFKLIIYEASSIGLIGAVIGIGFGCIGVYFLITKGIDFTEMYEGMDINDIGYRVTGLMKGAWNVKAIIGCFIGAPIIAALAAIGPAIRASKIKIVEALRFE